MKANHSNMSSNMSISGSNTGNIPRVGRNFLNKFRLSTFRSHQMARWADSDEESEQELQDAGWFKDDPGDLQRYLDSQTPSGSASSNTTKRQKTSSDGEFEFVDAPDTIMLKLRRKAPKEVEEQIMSSCKLEDRKDMADVLQKSLNSPVQLTSGSGRNFYCQWCKKPGPKSMRLTVQYNTSEWRSATFRLCFECCQGTSDTLTKEANDYADKYYNSQPSDVNFDTMRRVEDAMGGVWSTPDEEAQEPTDGMRPVVMQRIIAPGTSKIHLDAGDEIDIEATAAMSSVQCCYKEPSRLPTIDIVWDKVDRETRHMITIRPFSNNFHEIPAANNGKSMVTKATRFGLFEATRMRPPNWDDKNNRWVYQPMFTGKEPLKEFKSACKQANTEWDACQAMDYFTFRNERYKLVTKCAEAEANGRTLTFKEKTDALRNSRMALGLLTVCPVCPRALTEKAAEFKKRLLDHFERCHRMCTLFDRWDEDFKYKIDPHLQQDFARRVFGSDRLLDYLDKVTAALNEHWVCRVCGHFGPSAHWVEKGGQYLCPCKDCWRPWHGRNINDTSTLLPFSHVWAFHMANIDPDLPLQEALTAPGLANNVGGAKSTMANPLLTGRAVLMDQSLQLAPRHRDTEDASTNWIFKAVDWSNQIGKSGTVDVHGLTNELKAVWNEVTVRQGEADIQEIGDQVWKAIEAAPSLEYFDKQTVPDDYIDQAREYRKLWHQDTKNDDKMTIVHWPIDRPTKLRYFDHAAVDPAQFPPGKNRRDAVLGPQEQLELYGTSLFWCQVSKDNFNEIKRWICQGEVPEGLSGPFGSEQ